MSADSREEISAARGDASAAAHIPVLRDEILAAVTPVAHGRVVDCTLGLGGHAEAILLATPESVQLIGFDADEGNISLARARLERFGSRLRTVHANFATLADSLHTIGIGSVDAIIADLGLSSNQIADAARGFSFEADGPLDMRLDPSSGETVAELLGRINEAELATLIYVQSQERASRRIAKRICEARRGGRLNSTLLLARLAADAAGMRSGGRRGSIHPATRTFMALRMAVNREGETLAALLRQVPSLLRPGGRAAVISFHSGEDRLVKESFRAGARSGIYQLITKKPVTPSQAEQRRNPRSRSAKLRVAERTATGFGQSDDIAARADEGGLKS